MTERPGENREAAAPSDLGPLAEDEVDLTELRADEPLIARWTPEGVYTFVSVSSRRLLGFPRAEMVGRSIFDFVHPADRVKLQQLVETATKSWTYTTGVCRHRRSAGDYSWLEYVAYAHRDPASKQVRELSTSARDVTARVLLEHELRKARDALSLAIEYAAAGVGTADLEGRWRVVNPALAALSGYSTDELLTMRVTDLVVGEDLDRHEESMQILLRGQQPSVDVDERFATRDGTRVWVRVVTSVVRDEDGNPEQLVIQVSDLRRLKERELDLERQALLDPLTGVANRRLLHDRIAQALSNRRRGGGHLALAMIDLDGFKAINDRYGHAAGDAVLTTVARRLGDAVREEDTVARPGGDEFVVVCPGLRHADEANTFLARLRAAFDEPILVDDRTLTVTASVGIVIAGATETVDSMLRKADTQMYRAKRPGAARR